MEDQLILVNSNDIEIGVAGKKEVHEQGLLHRAISVFIFNDNGELLLQQRAAGKYHSGGLWTNTCCSHPRPGEATINAAGRRLFEEMGINASLKFFKSFHYEAKFPNGLIENEIDHIFFGKTNQSPSPDAKEVEDWKHISPDDLVTDIKQFPQNYSAWLKICIDRNLFWGLVEIIQGEN